MKVTLTASSGAQVVVWEGNDTYYARRADAVSEPEICLAVDLFEVIAELAGLDLDDRHQAAEAMLLADAARESASRAQDGHGNGAKELCAEQCQNGA